MNNDAASCTFPRILVAEDRKGRRERTKNLTTRTTSLEAQSIDHPVQANLSL
ncbi:uncharacterized protein G2W53_011140 [Senna tora]|uniref:Uncharacterized protein n=1 Tax=Senna tora TaxID=362788 RepID=A0A835CC50_9FABA|nr:uncharacterized protein G2W53_011140 [Senna tora]